MEADLRQHSERARRKCPLTAMFRRMGVGRLRATRGRVEFWMVAVVLVLVKVYRTHCALHERSPILSIKTISKTRRNMLLRRPKQLRRTSRFLDKRTRRAINKQRTRAAIKPWTETKRRRDYYEPLPLLEGDQVKIQNLKGRFIKKFNGKIGKVIQVFGENLFEVKIKMPDEKAPSDTVRLVEKKIRVNSKQIAQVYSPFRADGFLPSTMVQSKEVFEYRMVNKSAKFGGIGVRQKPNEGSKRTGKVVGRNKEVFNVDRILEADSGQRYLHLHDGSGWVFARDPDNLHHRIAVCVGKHVEQVMKEDKANNLTRNKYFVAKYHSVPLHLLEENKEGYDSDDPEMNDKKGDLKGLDMVEELATEFAQDNQKLQEAREKYGVEVSISDTEDKDARNIIAPNRQSERKRLPRPPPQSRLTDVIEKNSQRMQQGFNNAQGILERYWEDRQEKMLANIQPTTRKRREAVEVKQVERKVPLWKQKKEKAIKDAIRDQRVRRSRSRRWAEEKAREEHKKDSFSRRNLHDKLRAQGIDPRPLRVGYNRPKNPRGSKNGK